MNEPIRLLFVTKSTGGVGSYVRSLVGGLDRKKFSITVACLSENGPEFAAELREKYGVNSFSLAMNRYMVNPVTDAWVWLRLALHIRKAKYDLIHAHASKPGYLARFAAIGTGVPVIYSPHNFAFHEGSKKITATVVALLERIAAVFTAKIVAVAGHERDLALRYGVGSEDLYSVVHTGIDPDPFRSRKLDVASLKKSIGLPLHAKVVGTVGRMAVPKLPMEFISMASKLHTMMPDVHFIWAGSGPLEAEAKLFASSLGLDEVFHWLGHRSDVPALFSVFDCFVLQSKWEAYPLVILESFASGVPVVASENLGTLELIESGKNGWITPQGDIDAIADRVRNILENETVANSFRSEAGKQVDNEYTMEKMLSTLEQIYLKAISDS
jgi:glycosyltransferase involved in cell wall biosynthesis